MSTIILTIKLTVYIIAGYGAVRLGIVSKDFHKQLSALMLSVPLPCLILRSFYTTELTDEALLSGYGDPLGEAGMQLTLSIAGKVDGDVLAALTKIGAEMTYTASEPISADVIADALVKLGEKEGGEKVLVVAPAQLAQLRKSEGWLKATDVGAMRLVSGAVGMIHGCQVIVSDKITASGGNFTNYIVMPGALVLFLKKDTEVESQRDIVHKSTVVTADKYYAVYLVNVSKAVKLVCKETAASAPSGTGGGSGG